ncbi:hypothetical protein [Flavobacterium nitratireducens]|uniref:hypothetical protein n=1 Tax=Flavobacterium nitratireducens TaxID=992289 RepID=UPI002414F9CD|nr:hypothetical protein [Flavobacterium nitratireducens]
MLNKGLRDQESIRIDNIFRTLHSLVFVPKLDDEDFPAIDEQLKGFGLSLERINEIPEKELIQLIQRCHLDWEQQERFADILVQMSQQNKFHFLEKAIAIYNYIQAESKMFSFGIFNKIATAKSNLR